MNNDVGTLDHFPYPTLTEALKPPSIQTIQSIQSIQPVPKVNTVVFSEVKPTIINTPKPKPTAAKPRHPIDPLSIAMDIKNPMYAMANAMQRKAMECEEAQRLEGLLTELYRSQGGRTRGWTLSGLEPMMKPRCASGANLHELQKAKAAFDWMLEDKVSVAFLDFLCVAQQIRVAVWSPDKKTVTLYPAADRASHEKIPLFHVEEGAVKTEEMDGPALVRFVEANGWTLTPPQSVLKSLAHLSVPELESVSTKVGLTDFVGNKAERIVALGTFKVKQRLL